MSFFPYETVSAFFADQGDFPENEDSMADLEPLSGLPEAERCPVCGQPDSCGDCDHTPLSDAELASLGLYREPEDPCCLLYREHYPQDHEYGCSVRARAEGRQPSAPSDR